MPQEWAGLTAPDPVRRPPQYGIDGRCTQCCRPLSRYNPYVVCGPCRVRMAALIPAEIASREEPDGTFVWERFPRREKAAGGEE